MPQSSYLTTLQTSINFSSQQLREEERQHYHYITNQAWSQEKSGDWPTARLGVWDVDRERNVVLH